MQHATYGFFREQLQGLNIFNVKRAWHLLYIRHWSKHLDSDRKTSFRLDTSRITICNNSLNGRRYIACRWTKCLHLSSTCFPLPTQIGRPSSRNTSNTERTCLYTHLWICTNYFRLDVKQTIINRPINEDDDDYEIDNDEDCNCKDVCFKFYFLKLYYGWNDELGWSKTWLIDQRKDNLKNSIL